MIHFHEEWLIGLLFQRQGSVVFRACCFALPSTLLGVGLLVLDDLMEDWRADIVLERSGIGSMGSYWSAVSAGLVFAIGFRTNRAIMRFWEGTGLLHQMRGEWFDTVSNCVAFTLRAKKSDYKIEKVAQFRHTLVRLMSLCHGHALEEISGNEFEIATLDTPGLDIDTMTYLKCSETHGFNKVEIAVHLIQTLIVDAHNEGILDIPPPIVSRVFQTISRGFVHLLNTKKITDTKFPFPYAQLIAILLFAVSVLTPVLFSSVLTSKMFVGIVSFLPPFVMAALNAVAIEIENPFGKDSNDLPMDQFQEEMDNCLLMLLSPHADVVPTVKPTCVFDFEDLFEQHRQRKEEASFVRAPSGETRRRYDTRYLAHHSAKSGMNDESQGLKRIESPEAPKPTASASLNKSIEVADVAVKEKKSLGNQALHVLEEPDKCVCAEKTAPLLVKSVMQSDAQQLLMRNGEIFNSCLMSWTKLVEKQVNQLSHHFRDLHRLVEHADENFQNGVKEKPPGVISLGDPIDMVSRRPYRLVPASSPHEHSPRGVLPVPLPPRAPCDSRGQQRPIGQLSEDVAPSFQYH